MVQNKIMKLLLKPLGKLDFFGPDVNSSLPFWLHAACFGVTVVILEEEITSTCSNGWRAWEGFTIPTHGKDLPALTQSNCYCLHLCVVPPRQRTSSNQPDRLEVFQINQELAPVVDWWILIKVNSRTWRAENCHWFCCSSAFDMQCEDSRDCEVMLCVFHFL